MWFLIVALVIAFVNVVKLSFVFSHGLFLIFLENRLPHPSFKRHPRTALRFPEKKFSGKKYPPLSQTRGKVENNTLLWGKNDGDFDESPKMMHHDFWKTLLVDKRGFFCKTQSTDAKNQRWQKRGWENNFPIGPLWKSTKTQNRRIGGYQE